MTYSYQTQPRLSKFELQIRRAHAVVNSGKTNMVELRNLLRRVKTLPLGFPAWKVLSERSR